MNTPYPCPYHRPFVHDLDHLAEEAAYRARRAEQERLAQADLEALLREQDEEREDDDREPREYEVDHDES